MITIGEGSEFPGEFVYEWRIKDFLFLSCKGAEIYKSPLFQFSGAAWYLSIIPHDLTTANFDSSLTSNGFYILHLRLDSSDSPKEIAFTLGLKTVEGKLACKIPYVANIFTEGAGKGRFFLRSKLLRRMSELMPSGDLTVVCKIKYPESSKVTSDGSLCQEYKKVLLEGSYHDLILRVGDMEFPVHRDNLKARSNVFWSTLELDMKEKNSDSVDIPDCSPDAMKQFLLYVYSGKVETLDQNNMLGLYYIADKYDVKGLQQECRDFIKESLSLTNISKVIRLAMNHCDSVLLEKATEYFGANMVGIMRTVEWQVFLKENSTVANELLLKCIEKSNSIK